METKFNSEQYKDFLKKEWDVAAKDWDEWFSYFEACGGRKLSERLVDLAEISLGQNVLDVATGVGQPALTAAEKIGSVGKITAIDISCEMIAVAQKKANNRGLKNIQFQIGDAEEAVFPENFFDAALCQLGLMYFPNLQRVLEKIKKSLIPGGKFAAAVWPEVKEVPFMLLVLKAVQKYSPLPKPLPGTPNPFCLANVTVLGQQFLKAGFSNIKIMEEPFKLSFESAGLYKSIMQGLLGHLSNKDEIWQEVEVSTNALPGWPVIFDNKVVYIVAQNGRLN